MEKAYPVWRIHARWNNKEYQNNGTSFIITNRRNYSIDTMQRRAEKWFKKYIKDKYPNEKIEPILLEVEYFGKETWSGSWFSHISLNRFETEKEAFESFQRYMNTLKQKDYSDPYSGMYITKSGQEYCVMGAEERYRWVYCDCKICKRKGITLIKH